MNDHAETITTNALEHKINKITDKPPIFSKYNLIFYIFMFIFFSFFIAPFFIFAK